MARHQKPLSKTSKILLYFSIVFTAMVVAALTVCFVLHFIIKDTPFSVNCSNYLSLNQLSDLLDEYDIVEIIEPDAQQLPVQIDDDTITITVTEIIELVEEVEQTEENTIVVKLSTIDTSGLLKRQVKLDFDYLSQYPELPTGCEITSLTTVLNYYGYDVSKTTMSDDYLEKSIDKVADFWKVFLGNPRSNGFGCYAQPIVDAANKYLEQQDNKYKALNVSGSDFEELLKEVEGGNPVIIWSTMYGEKENDLREPYTTYKWEIDGKTIQWIAPEHCMVLIGYDIDRNIAIMSDPQRGIVEYNLETVKSRYTAMHSQCVILQKNDLPPVITGVTDGQTYYTTQFITVTDNDLKSVTVNYEHCSNEFFINANADNSYEIIATDTSGNKTTITIHTKAISSIAEPIAELDELNVTDKHFATICNVRDLAFSITTEYATKEETEEINSIIFKCDMLIDKIEAVNNELSRIDIAVNDYESETPTNNDAEAINTLIADINSLTLSENLTQEQRDHLAILKSKCVELLSLITSSDQTSPPEQDEIPSDNI